MRIYFRIAFAMVILLAFATGIQPQTEPDSPVPDAKEEEKEKEVVEQQLDEVSITATRVKRKTQDVPASISVVGKEKIEDARMHNIQDALSGTPGIQVESKNGGYDSRLIIRGAGTKARYGIREIMILLNGVPVTDPDGFSKLDLIDPQQIEQIEVVKGPNSTLWGANAAGGVINIITKSPLTEKGGFVKVGGGIFNSRNSAFSYANNINNSFMYMVSGSYIASDNNWREWNKYSAYNGTFQPSVVFDDGTTWENYISYNKSDLQLPGTTDEVLYADYERTGDLTISAERKALLRLMDGTLQTEINPSSRENIWKYSGRYSDSAFFHSKLTKKMGNFTLKPMVYGTRWSHHHPVTGMINDAVSYVYGGDLQADWKHDHGTLTVGAMGRLDRQDGRGYEYGDLTILRYGPKGKYSRISAVNSDAEGDLSSRSSDHTRLAGVYIQESLKLDRWLIDLGLRHDRINFNLKGNIESYYDYAAGNYTDCTMEMQDCGQPVYNKQYDIHKIFDAPSPRLGISFKIIPQLSVYTNAAAGIQTPTASEISSNPDLKLVQVKNGEVGFKGRGTSWSFDIGGYHTLLENEVVPQLMPGGKTVYANAGKTLKRGFEAEAMYIFAKVFSIGGSYTRTNYLYLDFVEIVTNPKTYAKEMYDRGGKTLPYAPTNQHAGFIQYKTRDKSGFKARLQAETWGPYYIDSANSETYRGVKAVTSLMVGYQIEEKLDFTVNVYNLNNRRYAVEVQKDPAKGKIYSVAPPRSVSFALTAKF